MLLNVLLLSILALCHCDSKPSAYDEINKYIFGLKYDPNNALVYHGPTIVDPGKSEGKLDDRQNFIFIKREKKTMSNPDMNLGLVDLNENRIYPGVLLRANDNLLDQKADVVAIDRNTMRYTVNLQGLTRDDVFDIKPVYSEYQGALEKTKNNWFVAHPEDQVTPAKFHVEKSLIHSKSQMTVKFGLSSKIIQDSLDFEALHSNEKTIMVYKFTQNFFKVSVDYPHKPADVFGPSVELDEVRRHFDSANPPLYVDSLTYGRIIYVSIETTSTENEAKAALSLQFTTFSGNAEASAKFSFKDLKMSVFVYGGSPDHIDIISATSFADVENVIKKHSSFSRSNPGAPIFYSTIFLKDNVVARVSGMTEYTDIKKTVTNHGVINLKQYAACYMWFLLEWDEENVDSAGTITLEHKRNAYYAPSLPKNIIIPNPFDKDVLVPGNAKNIHYQAQSNDLFGDWTVIGDYKNVPLIPYRSFKTDNKGFFVFRADPIVKVSPSDDLQ